jgi:hypothetical protein
MTYQLSITSTSMTQIFPTIDCDIKCPVDGESLSIDNVIIPGMRCLADAVCPHCQNKYYVDLPVGQALWSQIFINQHTQEVYDQTNSTWFSQPLLEGFRNPSKESIVPRVHTYFKSSRIIILNCLDFLYGHSLLKLLNVQRYLDQHPDLGCCVLVPSQLVHLVPEGVAEIWEVPISFKDGLQWFPSLADWIDNQIKTREVCFLSPAYSHPGPTAYNFSRFSQHLPDISKEVSSYSPIIVFSYREDRLWGKTIRDQQRNLEKLYKSLNKLFSNLAFVLIGFGNKNKIYSEKNNIFDLRQLNFDQAQDQVWMAYMKAAHCTIGVHGSNMLLPSGLSKTILELVPRSRLGNTVQDFLFPSRYDDPRQTLLNYRLIYGDDHLSDLRVSQVVDQVANLLSYSALNTQWFQVGQIRADFFDVNKYYNDPVFIAAKKHLDQDSDWQVKRRLKGVANRLLDLLS